MRFLICLFILITYESSAQELIRYSNNFDVATDIISEDYEAGPFLLYDCEKKHWVCVMEEFYKECEQKRVSESQNADLTRHSCATIGFFPNKKSCFQRQLYLTTHHHGARFCIKDEWKEKAD